MLTRTTENIKHLIIITALFYAANWYFSARGVLFFEALALQFPTSEGFGFWQYLSYMFLHGSLAHIFFNMYGLYAFGTPLEQIWGRHKFLLFYFVTGIGAGLVYTLVNYLKFNHIYEQLIAQNIHPDTIQKMLTTNQYNPNLISLPRETLGNFYELYHSSAVGASGAIYGLLVAFGLSFPNAKLMLIFVPYPISAKYFIPIMIAVDLFFGVTSYSMGNIAHFAHIGGAFIGFVLAWQWKKKSLIY